MSVSFIYGYKFTDQEIIEYNDNLQLDQIEILGLTEDISDVISQYISSRNNSDKELDIQNMYREFYLPKGFVKEISEGSYSESGYPEMIFGVLLDYKYFRYSNILSLKNQMIINDKQKKKIKKLKSIYHFLGEPEIYMYIFNR
jgi:hypothetical protein